jgi:hypothetical protein
MIVACRSRARDRAKNHNMILSSPAGCHHHLGAAHLRRWPSPFAAGRRPAAGRRRRWLPHGRVRPRRGLQLRLPSGWACARHTQFRRPQGMMQPHHQCQPPTASSTGTTDLENLLCGGVVSGLESGTPWRQLSGAQFMWSVVFCVDTVLAHMSVR